MILKKDMEDLGLSTPSPPPRWIEYFLVSHRWDRPFQVRLVVWIGGQMAVLVMIETPIDPLVMIEG
jgi:hypothetical protein